MCCWNGWMSWRHWRVLRHRGRFRSSPSHLRLALPHALRCARVRDQPHEHASSAWDPSAVVVAADLLMACDHLVRARSAVKHWQSILQQNNYTDSILILGAAASPFDTNQLSVGQPVDRKQCRRARRNHAVLNPDWYDTTLASPLWRFLRSFPSSFLAQKKTTWYDTCT